MSLYSVYVPVYPNTLIGLSRPSPAGPSCFVSQDVAVVAKKTHNPNVFHPGLPVTSPDV